MDYEELLEQKYQELRKQYEVEDPWQFEANLYERIRHESMAEFTLAVAPQKVTDLGCGEGHFLGRLLARSPKIHAIGVEYVPKAATRCQARLAQYNAKILTMDPNVPGVYSLLRPEGGVVISAGDDRDWTHQLFEERFQLVKQVHIKPRVGPPPCAWVVSLLIRRDNV